MSAPQFTPNKKLAGNSDTPQLNVDEELVRQFEDVTMMVDDSPEEAQEMEEEEVEKGSQCTDINVGNLVSGGGAVTQDEFRKLIDLLTEHYDKLDDKVNNALHHRAEVHSNLLDETFDRLQKECLSMKVDANLAGDGMQEVLFRNHFETLSTIYDAYLHREGNRRTETKLLFDNMKKEYHRMWKVFRKLQKDRSPREDVIDCGGENIKANRDDDEDDL